MFEVNITEASVDAVEQVWLEFHQRLYAFLVKKTRCPDTAQDILQEVFIKVHKGLPKLKNQETLTSWLYQLCFTTFIDHIRKVKSSPIDYQAEDAGEFEQLSDVKNSEELAEVSRCIEILIAELPEEQKAMLHDRELAGFKQQQVAEKYQLSLSAAKSRLIRGRQALKQKLMACCTFEFTESGIRHECKRQCGCQR